MDEVIGELKATLATFDAEETVRYLWPVLDAARAVVRTFEELSDDS